MAMSREGAKGGRNGEIEMVVFLFSFFFSFRDLSPLLKYLTITQTCFQRKISNFLFYEFC